MNLKNALFKMLQEEGPTPSCNDLCRLLATVAKAASEQPITLWTATDGFAPLSAIQMLNEWTLGVAAGHHDDPERQSKIHASDQIRTFEADYEDLDPTVREYEHGLQIEIDGCSGERP